MSSPTQSLCPKIGRKHIELPTRDDTLLISATAFTAGDDVSRDPPFIKKLDLNGCLGSVVSIEHLDELGAEVRSWHMRGLIDDGLFREYLGPYSTPEVPKSIRNAKSIIVVATPQPMVRTAFYWKGQRKQAIVPPTYFDAHKVIWRARNELKKAFGTERHKFVRCVLPVKLLAVRSGLAKYGKNNITYVPTHGSFHRLTAFYSDYDSQVDNWQEKKALPLCAKCNACAKACPTKAIGKDRFLIRAEKCLTYLNEKPAKHGFPKWLDSKAHNALVGCMRCQKACPYNKNVADWCEDRREFSQKETEYLLKGRYKGIKAKEMQKKLKSIGLDLSVMPRNLKVILDRE